MSYQIICQAQNCNQKAKFVCSNCEKSFYCSEKHHKDNWKIHRLSCGQLPVPEYDRPEISPIQLTNAQNLIDSLAISQDQLEQDSEQQKERIRNKETKQERKMRRQEQARKKEKDQIKNALIKQMRTPDVQARGADLKKKIDNRQNDRASILSNYLSQNYITALLACKRVTMISQRITLDVIPAVIVELQYKYFLKTSKLLQEIQCLFDNLLMIRILSCMDKLEDIKDIIRKLKFPSLNPPPEKISNFVDKDERILFNTWRKQVTNYQCVVRGIFQVIAKKQMVPITEKVLQKYVQIIQQAYGDLELGTAYFMIGTWYSDIGQSKQKNLKIASQFQKRIQKSKIYFDKCLQIRQKYGDSLPLADVLLNLAMVQWNIAGVQIEGSIQKVQRCLKIRKNIIAQPNQKLLFPMQLLGRLYMLSGQFHKSFEILFQCLKLQKILYADIDQKNLHAIEQKTKVQVLIVFLYKNIQKYVIKQPNINEADELKKLFVKIKTQVIDVYQQFQNYAIDDSQSVESHFKLKVSDQLFEALSANQTDQLSKIFVILQTVSYSQGINIFKSSLFYQKLDKQKKTMILISNPNLDKVENKKNTPKSMTPKFIKNKLA